MLETAKADVIAAFKVMWTQIMLRMQGMQIQSHSNWPEPGKRLTISSEVWEQLKKWFLDENGGFEKDCVEAQHYCARRNGWRYEAASSGSGNAQGIYDLKIFDINYKYTAFNYHIQVA